MTTQQSLNSLKQEFIKWRKTKKSLRSKVPDDLRRKVLALRPYVSDTDLNKSLGIKPPMIQTWSEREAVADQASQNDIDFVSLPTEFLHNEVQPMPVDHSSGQVQLTCHQANGNRWSLQGDVNPQQLAVFIQALNSASGVSQ